ncbi:MAG TPA: hypothetical protein PK646_05930 [Bacillota bacterium]|jgi:uncharacterized membrane protein|nr:hypothetical protein [Fastidiosipila sp.]HPX93782.1 hypothetical protein [Bacillota bacterium]HQB81607.1 hypothetical protein [Bacillota bacterium]
MEKQLIMMGLVRFLHELFTVLWVGGLAFMSLTLVPSLSKVLGDGEKNKEMMKMVTRRHRIWIYLSMVGLIVTGLLLGRSSPSFTGFLHFDNLYSALTAVKHLLIVVMVVIALFRSIKFGKKDQAGKPGKHRVNVILIRVNFALGVVVILLSAFAAATR